MTLAPEFSKPLPLEQTEELDRLADRFRYILVALICKVKWGHLGGTMSLVEIIIMLYFRIMRVNPKNPRWPDRDRLVLSKGHAGPVVYVALAAKGYFAERDLLQLNANGSFLPSHCDMRRTPGIDMTAGSLGQGISCACGMALWGKRFDKKHRVFCIIGDGESNEGEVWEAALFAGHQHLDNLIVICDYNHLQIDGYTDDICTLEPFAEKWKAFGWEALETDGHDWNSLHGTFQKAMSVTGKPVMIIAHTIKARGHRDFENKASSHSVRISTDGEKMLFLQGVKPVYVEWLKEAGL